MENDGDDYRPYSGPSFTAVLLGVVACVVVGITLLGCVAGLMTSISVAISQ